MEKILDIFDLSLSLERHDTGTGEVCGYLPDKGSVIDSCRTPIRQNRNLCFPVDTAGTGDGYTKLSDMLEGLPCRVEGGSKLKAFYSSLIRAVVVPIRHLEGRQERVGVKRSEYKVGGFKCALKHFIVGRGQDWNLRPLNFSCAHWTMALFFDQSLDLVQKITVDTERDFIFNTNMVQFTGERVTLV